VNCSNAASRSSAISVAERRASARIGIRKALVLNPKQVKAELVTLEQVFVIERTPDCCQVGMYLSASFFSGPSGHRKISRFSLRGNLL